MAGVKALVRLTFSDRREERALAASMAATVALRARNVLARSSVTGDAPVTVSMTTYGARTALAHVAVESVARGIVRPARFVLWIDDPAVLASPPPGLRRLQRRGLELRGCPDLGPHKKQYPYATSADRGDLPLAVADDDVLYPRTWLEGLTTALGAAPDVVHGYRASTVRVEGGRIAPYGQWAPATSSAPSFATFCTGVSGIIYPRALLDALAREGEEFLERAPRADDVWVHAVSVRARIRTSQIGPRGADFATVPNSQRTALFRANVGGGGNDAQVAASYGAQEIAAIGNDADLREPAATATP